MNTFHYAQEKDHTAVYDDVPTMRDHFITNFPIYVNRSESYHLDEFLGDRVFNLEMARRLTISHTATTAKSAISIYSSNRTMSEAMEKFDFPLRGDMLSSDLEVACAQAFKSGDQRFINEAVQCVIEYAVNNTHYDEEWFEHMGKVVEKKEKSNHAKKKYVVDYSKEPVGQLMGYLDSVQMPHPEPVYSQDKGGLWRCVFSHKGIEFSAVSSTKKDAMKSCCFQVLNMISQ